MGAGVEVTGLERGEQRAHAGVGWLDESDLRVADLVLDQLGCQFAQKAEQLGVAFGEVRMSASSA
jgi:hypothetical protein